jgi:hypothetical protein
MKTFGAVGMTMMEMCMFSMCMFCCANVSDGLSRMQKKG